MESSMIKQLQMLYEKQDILSKLRDHTLYTNLNLSEVHCLEVIYRLDTPNASEIGVNLQVTRGAVSKIIKKLVSKGFVETFQKPENKKEKFHRLTEQGIIIAKKHRQAHEEWEKEDLQFIDTIGEIDKEIVENFLKKFNSYLEQLIEEKTK